MAAPALRRAPFGTTRDGETVTRFELTGRDGLSVALLDYGATVQALTLPDGTGVVLGYDDLRSYEDDPWYLGAVVGRTAGRVRDAELTVDGVRYRLSANDGTSHLHGGARGFSRRVWQATTDEDAPSVTFALRSADGEEGYPGTLDARVTYTLEPGALVVEYHATTDRTTVVNLTQHAYFNLAGEGAGPVLDHVLEIPADAFAPLEAGLVPGARLEPVAGTPFDFRAPHALGERLAAEDAQLRLARGYDHSFAVRRASDALALAARVLEPRSRRTLEVWTTEPAVHLYTGNFLDGTRAGRGGHQYGRHEGFCLETQRFATALASPSLPSMVLRPGEVRRTRTEFRVASAPRA